MYEQKYGNLLYYSMIPNSRTIYHEGKRFNLNLNMNNLWNFTKNRPMTTLQVYVLGPFFVIHQYQMVLRNG